MNTLSSNERMMRVLQAPPDQLAAIDRILSGAPAPSSPESGAPILIRIRTAAVMLDAHRATVWRMIHAGKLQTVEILSGSVRVRRADVEAIAMGKEKRTSSTQHPSGEPPRAINIQ
jgi:excisionase family DNA binding protein